MRKFLLIATFLIASFSSLANDKNFFDEAKKLFEDEKYEDSKFLFQRNIVYNPKHANSYLYLAKIFKIEEDKSAQEKNIDTTLLLDPKNEEAMYLLIDMEIERSDFLKVEKLKKDFKSICSFLCEKLTLIEDRLKEFEKKDAS